MDDEFVPFWSWAFSKFGDAEPLTSDVSLREQDGIYGYELLYFPLRQRLAKISNVEVENVGQDPLAQVLSASLRFVDYAGRSCQMGVKFRGKSDMY